MQVLNKSLTTLEPWNCSCTAPRMSSAWLASPGLATEKIPSGRSAWLWRRVSGRCPHSSSARSPTPGAATLPGWVPLHRREGSGTRTESRSQLDRISPRRGRSPPHILSSWPTDFCCRGGGIGCILCLYKSKCTAETVQPHNCIDVDEQEGG